MLIAWCMSRSWSKLWTWVCLCVNLVIGRRARRRYACSDVLLWMHGSIFVRLISRGWAIWLPLITEILVLSSDKTTPRRVAPGGSTSCMVAGAIIGKPAEEKLGLTCMFQAQSPLNHSSYIQQIFAALVQTLLGMNNMCDLKSEWLSRACKHSMGSW